MSMISNKMYWLLEHVFTGALIAAALALGFFAYVAGSGSSVYVILFWSTTITVVGAIIFWVLFHWASRAGRK